MSVDVKCPNCKSSHFQLKADSNKEAHIWNCGNCYHRYSTYRDVFTMNDVIDKLVTL